MNIIKVIVDKLPNATNQCHLHKSTWDNEKMEMTVSCSIRDEMFVMSLDYYIKNCCPNCPLEEVQESEATSCKFCGSNKSDIRMNSIVCSGCGRKIGNVAPPEVQE